MQMARGTGGVTEFSANLSVHGTFRPSLPLQEVPDLEVRVGLVGEAMPSPAVVRKQE